ncbi:uncharacterized protein PHACADRAFT_261466 [Phanerochaete carnosa HHB-10118-sp]|uniref:Uncharacterized protein n=1 Tax=Phanerochaete carnosa (strain HHB-10118-sp) TaxID=650164 RepID=K5WR52_PHACS|nr:uncharacterized protein PHACADRAFT_261466 [Phanerochaete carnosa HHB-10118-sp]EKM52817.1 hypothetical protein PHACADRAFT_261466 [Phanerochaete carnosa HHB-10118-sp]
MSSHPPSDPYTLHPSDATDLRGGVSEYQSRIERQLYKLRGDLSKDEHTSLRPAASALVLAMRQ